MRVPKTQPANTSRSCCIKGSKSNLDLDLNHNDSFNEDSVSFYGNEALALSVMVEPSRYSDYFKTPSFRSHFPSHRWEFLSVSPQVSIGIPAGKPSEKRVKKEKSVYSYWKIPAALGLLGLIMLSKR